MIFTALPISDGDVELSGIATNNQELSKLLDALLVQLEAEGSFEEISRFLLGPTGARVSVLASYGAEAPGSGSPESSWSSGPSTRHPPGRRAGGRARGRDGAARAASGAEGP